MLIEGIDTINIMYGKDGGEQVYVRKRHDREMTLSEKLEGLSEWIDIMESAKSDDVLRDLMERIIIYYRLKKEEHGKSSQG